MSRLILDFIRRRWWMLLMLILFSTLLIACETSLIVSPFGLIVLLSDAHRGLIRTTRPLPVSRRAQAGAWWFLGVLLVPLLTVLAHPLGALLHQAREIPPRLVPVPATTGILPFDFVPDPHRFDPWFVSAAAAWIGLGYSALCYLLCIGLPTRPANSTVESIQQSVFGALWGLSMSAPMLFMFILPKNAGVILPWHWVAFAAVPVLVVLSFMAAPEMAERRTSVAIGGRVPAPASRDRQRGGLTGIPLVFASIMSSPLLFLLLVASIQILIAAYAGRPSIVTNPSNFGQIMVFAIAFGVGAVESTGLRMLRALPLSTRQLALLLLSIPATLGLICGTLMSVLSSLYEPSPSFWLDLGARSAVVAGAGGLALVASLHINSLARLVPLIFFALVPIFAVMAVPQFPLLVLLGGIVSLAAACALLERGLQKSPTFYRPRRAFGVNFGQPFSAR